MSPRKLNPILTALLIVAVVIGAVLFFYRLSILKYTAETIIRSVLPDYISVETISFDLGLSRISLKGFCISNPLGFSSEHLIEIADVSCRYKMKGKTILDGLEIIEPVFKKPVIYIERRSDGRLNLNEMSNVLLKGQGGGSPAARPPTLKAAREEAKAKGVAAGRAAGAAAMVGNKKLSDIVKLPEIYNIKDGKIIFNDNAAPGGPRKFVFEGIAGQISVKLSEAYTRVIGVGSTGEGYLNNDKSETVRWVIDLNPNTQKLTMSNRFNVSGVYIKPFEPYYDRYSPLIFRSGTFSGTLVFDFDNGNIGSTNEVQLSGISFVVKPGAENKEFWGSSVPDLVRYFTTASGDIVFDFKIKGDMANPKFYFGPISKRAITSMAVDKISAILNAATAPADGGAPAQSKEEAQAKAIADAVKLIFKKSK
jgi:hypothetical protein